MKTESMVTRAARAMFASQQWPEQFHPSFEVEQERFETAARAAIEAMRAPSRPMFAAAEDFVVGCCNMSEADLAGVWVDMIDRALSEEGE